MLEAAKSSLGKSLAKSSLKLQPRTYLVTNFISSFSLFLLHSLLLLYHMLFYLFIFTFCYQYIQFWYELVFSNFILLRLFAQLRL